MKNYLQYPLYFYLHMNFILLKISALYPIKSFNKNLIFIYVGVTEKSQNSSLWYLIIARFRLLCISTKRY